MSAQHSGMHVSAIDWPEHQEVPHDDVEILAQQEYEFRKSNFEIEDIIQFLQWLDNVCSQKESLKLKFVVIRVSGDRQLNFKKLMLKGWLSTWDRSLRKQYGRIKILLTPHPRIPHPYTKPEQEAYTEIQLSNATYRGETYDFLYGLNAATIREVNDCLRWLFKTLYTYDDQQVGIVQSLLGRIRYWRYQRNLVADIASVERQNSERQMEIDKYKEDGKRLEQRMKEWLGKAELTRGDYDQIIKNPDCKYWATSNAQLLRSEKWIAKREKQRWITPEEARHELETMHEEMKWRKERNYL
ncbi:hypothetical protein ACFLVN_01680 [Chloroflexota bacterium]